MNGKPNNIPYTHQKGVLVKIPIFNRITEIIYLALIAKYFCYFQIILRIVDNYVYVVNVLFDEIIRSYFAWCLQGVFQYIIKIHVPCDASVEPRHSYLLVRVINNVSEEFKQR